MNGQKPTLSPSEQAQLVTVGFIRHLMEKKKELLQELAEVSKLIEDFEKDLSKGFK